jgi:hypothetical protein
MLETSVAPVHMATPMGGTPTMNMKCATYVVLVAACTAEMKLLLFISQNNELLNSSTNRNNRIIIIWTVKELQ